jgi:MFS transporter, PPP family, 3-phenylpropionic acid transporter
MLYYACSMMKINNTAVSRDLFFTRVYYFCYMGGWGFVLPFINLFYISLGFSGKQIGVISSVSAVIGMLVSPIWVDYVKKHPQARRILQIVLILGAIGYLMIGLQSVFIWCLVVVFLHSLSVAGILPISDSMAVHVAQESDAGYGSIRMFGSLGWIVSLLSAGWLVARFGYIAGFGGVMIMWIIASHVLRRIQPHFFTTQPVENQPKTNMLDALKIVWHDQTLRGFGIALIVIGFLNSGVLQFENVFLSQLGASKQLISVAGILSAVVELPFMIYADRIARRVGMHPLMLLALLLTFFQRLTVLIFPYIAIIMLVRFIGGIAFSFYTICFIGLVTSRTSSREAGTILALFSVTITGLVNIVAAPVSGAVFDVVGARWLYALSAAGYAIGLLCLWWTKPKAT